MLESRTVPENLYKATKHIEMKQNEVERNRDADCRRGAIAKRGRWQGEKSLVEKGDKTRILDADCRRGAIAKRGRWQGEKSLVERGDKTRISDADCRWQGEKSLVEKGNKTKNKKRLLIRAAFLNWKRRLPWQRHIYQSVKKIKKRS